jgi:FdhD protein
LNSAQPQRARNHTVHGAAWVSPTGKLHHIREDIGRHNALDKMIGARIRSPRQENEGLALVSSRCTFELVQKAALAGISILASLSAPSEAAIETALRSHLTLVSLHEKNSECVIFTAPERIRF